MENKEIVERIFQKIENIRLDFSSDNIKIQEIQHDSNLRDHLRLDELAITELLLWLEYEFKIEIYNSVEQFDTVQDIVDIIQVQKQHIT